MASIFPFTNPRAYASTPSTDLPLYYDVGWDYANDGYGAPQFGVGDPVVVSGLPAVMSWAWRALYTERFLNEVYSWNYGNEMMTVVGEPWDPGVKTAELSRYATECLTVSPYITGVYDFAVTFSGTRVTINSRVETVYGSGLLEVTI